jgi:hypothetical protein
MTTRRQFLGLTAGTTAGLFVRHGTDGQAGRGHRHAGQWWPPPTSRPWVQGGGAGRAGHVDGQPMAPRPSSYEASGPGQPGPAGRQQPRQTPRRYAIDSAGRSVRRST